MMRVLFVDDEKIVRDGMRTVVDWPANGCEPLLVAATVRQALKTIEERRPHIVITDINMNETNGIQFARILKEQHPEIVVVVLSGYEDFTYAREAMEAGVVRYLLKPLFPDELERLIQEIRPVWEQRMQRLSPEGPQKPPAAKPVAVESIWRAFLYGRYEDANALLAEAANAAISTADGDWQVIRAFQVSPKAASTVVLRTLREVLTPAYILPLEDNGGALLVLNYEVDIQRLQALAVQLKEMGAAMGFAVGGTVCGPLYLAESERSAQRAQSLYTQLAVAGVVQASDLDNSFAEGEYPAEAETALLDMLLYAVAWRPEPLRDFFQGLEGMREKAAWHAALVRLLTSLYKTMDSVDSLRLEPYHKQLALLGVQGSRKEAQAFFEHWLRAAMEKRGDAKTDPERLARTAAGIIERDFRKEGFSLADVAQELHISQGYLSRIFKRFNGTGAAEYLTALRIAQAKKLLRASGLTQAEIAAQAGYSSVYYFSTQFKRATGYTPGAYKKKGEPDE